MLSIVKVLREILAELKKIATNTTPAAAAGTNASRSTASSK